MMKYNFSDLNVLIIGDVMLDYYLFGQINRISSEAPVPIVDIESDEYKLGGAANVALNLKGLGANPTLVSIVGDDENGKRIISLLKDEQISSKHITKLENRLTSIKTRIFDDERQVVRFDKESDDDLSKDEEVALLTLIDTLIKKEKFHAVILQDYNKGILTKKIIKQVLLITTKLNIPVVVDPKEYNFFEYQQIDLFKPNLKELAEALSIKINPKSLSSLVKAAEELKRRNRFDNLFLTLGANGIFVYEKSGENYIVPARAIKTADVSGAGDTVVSIATLGFIKNWSLKEVAKISNLAASKVCKKVGVCPISLKDLK
jgi:rfaE bifunctional protein kinase chain/domain